MPRFKRFIRLVWFVKLGLIIGGIFGMVPMDEGSHTHSDGVSSTGSCREIHHLALTTDDMTLTEGFYVYISGML